DVTRSIARVPLRKPFDNSSGKLLKRSEKRRLPQLYGESSDAFNGILLHSASRIIDCRVCGFRFALVLSVHSSSILPSARINLWYLLRPSDCYPKKVLELLVGSRIAQTCLLKTFEPKPAAIATAA